MKHVYARMISRIDQSPEGCWVWPGATDADGYGTIRDGKRLLKVHRVMWEMVHGFTPPVVCHRCDNPPCVRPDHLFAGDHAVNQRDRKGKGRSAIGTRNGRAVLTEAQVDEMRERYVAGGISQQVLARKYGVSQSRVSRVVRGSAWSHLAQNS